MFFALVPPWPRGEPLNLAGLMLSIRFLIGRYRDYAEVYMIGQALVGSGYHLSSLRGYTRYMDSLFVQQIIVFRIVQYFYGCPLNRYGAVVAHGQLQVFYTH